MEKKKSIKKYIFTIVMALLVVVLLLIPYLAEKNARSSDNEASVLTGTVELGNISKTVSGAGTLTEQDAEDVSIADGVTVTKYLVSNGDEVKEGDALAAVDRTSVLVAISNVYDSMTEIMDEINDCKSDKLQGELYSTCNGTVKAVYAQTGDSVRDVMMEHGCLAVIERTNGDELKVTAVGGTVESVNIREGSRVYYATNLFVLTDVDSTGSAELLAEQYREYEDMSEDLFKMYQSGTITAPCDGVVSGIDEDAAEELDKTYSQHVISATNASYVQSGTTVSQIAAYLDADSDSQTVIRATELGHREDGDKDPNPSSGEDASPSEEGAPSDPGAGESTSTTITVTVQYTGVGDGYTITENQTGIPDESLKEAIKAAFDSGKVTLEAGSSYKITINAVTTGDSVIYSYTGIEPAQSGESGGSETPQGGGSGSETGMPSAGDMSSMGGMSSGMSMSVATTEEEFTFFSVEETTILSVIPQDTVMIPITVDELDILSIHLGDSATVTIDALTGRSFEGTVTEIDTSGETNNGGNSKYSATITLDRTEDMLDGMNASVLITVETKDNIPVIPVEALVESGTKTVVYTAMNQSGQPANPVEVETGISDGSKVEIVSGLTTGETIVYSYYDTLNIEGLSSNAGSGMSFSFGGGGPRG